MCVCSPPSSSMHVTLAFIFIICYSILLQDHLKQLRNMLKKSAVIEAKFKVVANKTLLKAHTLMEQEAGGDASNKISGEGTAKFCNVK